MTSPTKKTREELVASLHCPNCSKSVALLYQMDPACRSCKVYECRRCGTLLLEVYRPEDDKPDLRPAEDRGQFFDSGGLPIPYNEERVVYDVTEPWDDIVSWYGHRREQTDAEQAELENELSARKYDLERQLRAELCRMVAALAGKSDKRSGLSLVKR